MDGISQGRVGESESVVANKDKEWNQKVGQVMVEEVESVYNVFLVRVFKRICHIIIKY